MNKQTVLIASPSAAGCERIKNMLEMQGKLQILTHVLADAGFEDIPAVSGIDADILVLDVGDQGERLLTEWSARPDNQNLPVIVAGPADDPHIMRCAMQAGARDYLSQPLSAEELMGSVMHVLAFAEHMAEEPGDQGKLTAVINAKGGSGASVIASNLAHILAAFMERETALIDMDLQFGALPLSFDLQTRDSLLDVIGAVGQLDPVALRGFMTRHQSGLDVLGCMSEQLVMPWEVSADDIRKLLELSVMTYDHVVVDLPREVTPLTSLVLSSADRIMVVMQQSFTHLRDAKRIFEILRTYLGIQPHKLTLVINRHTDRNSITVDDVRDAVHPGEVMFVPNDFVNVTESLNIGVPLYQRAKNAPITRSLCSMAERVDAGAAKPPKADAGSKPKQKPERWSFPRLLGLNG